MNKHCYGVQANEQAFSSYFLLKLFMDSEV